MIDIKDIVSNDKKVVFKFFKSGELWYETETGFLFPVPVIEAGSAIFLAEDKAIMFMRYIRKHIALITPN